MKYSSHIPVMVKEVLDILDPQEKGIYLDCTIGAGGHSKAIMEKMRGKVKIVGIDLDEEALKIAKEELKEYKNQLVLKKENFKDLFQLLKEEKISCVNGILYDLGVSSMQLNTPERGFSFRYSALLDMRMDRKQELTAGFIVNRAKEEELKNIFLKLGEERWAGRIAKFIIKEREKHPLQTTKDLVEVARKAIPSGARKRRIHFATKIFQALRIKVNEELKNLNAALEKCPEILCTKGKICVISYHSLEDRIVKEVFKKKEGEGKLHILTKKVIKPSLKEVKRNPRARSAKLRAAKKI
ncbi:16S rRNA (cytosine(1402)-N(4))-methyltransferase RsmH [Candidatus Aerophobetes bacterium]|nr:16S rRNA (cytosine(1402)-N(4))-methyltransferase RsmH [Candidatus Aerophobetes bacterium]